MRVDVLVTGRPPGSTDTTTTMVLQNVPVLSAGQTLQADAGKQSITTPVVTLLVTPVDAVALTLANNEGHIQLVLRNSTDDKVAPAAGRQLRELYATASAAESPGPQRRSARAAAPKRIAPVATVLCDAPAPPEPAVLDTIVMIRGSKTTVERFQ
jgi:Flp pilus assembly protein CpaB